MEAVVDQPFGDVAGLDAFGRLELVAENHLVHGSSFIGEFKDVLQLFTNVVGVEDRVFGGLAQPVRPVGQDVSQCADEHAHIAVEGAHPAHRLRPVVLPVLRAVLVLDQHRDRQKRLQKRLAGHRSGAWAASSVGRREGFMQVQVHYVHTEVAGARLAHQGVHIGAVHVEQRALGMENFGDPGDLALKYPNRRWISKHQRGGLRVYLGGEGFDVDAPFGVGLEVFNRITADGRGRRIGAVGRVGDDDFAPRIALRLVPCANQ